ncbi:MFS transporter [Paucilactobacillus wasatchensis]|uniref:Xyloside transporter n=1 Tax=Paucilactobacillus wasatchensis TaxID=1335616 RepID=A0A0D1A7S3_9LACO|nr:glycoside-pentoside-hexuronide (GPH):cation symporter [Paucilactobacillus wasatchensis]KIS03757.1 Xyloside transporter [Paucilactobacillus wasatchensis]
MGLLTLVTNLSLTTTVSAYLVFFYTDVAKMSLGAVGLLMLIARLMSAVAAPLSGYFIDNTNTRWGKARPWYLWLCIPVAIFSILLFLDPNFKSNSMNVTYIWITYVIWSMLEIFINTPDTAILPMLTNDRNQRTIFNSFRNGGSQIGALIANAAVLPLVALFGAGNDKKGFLYMIFFLAFLSVCGYLFVFVFIREVNTSTDGDKNKNHVSVSDGFKAMKGNWAFVITFIVTILVFFAAMARNSSVIYYFRYNLNDLKMVAVINGLNSTQLISIALLPLLVRRLGQARTWMLGLFLSAIAQPLILMSHSNMGLIITFWIVNNLGMGICVPLIFAILADSADYGDWKNHIYAPGFLSGIGATTATKLGGGLGMGVVPWILGMFGYIAEKPQTTHALFGIEVVFIWVPFVCLLLAIIPAYFYQRIEKQRGQVQDDLAKRRSNIN